MANEYEFGHADNLPQPNSRILSRITADTSWNSKHKVKNKTHWWVSLLIGLFLTVFIAIDSHSYLQVARNVQIVNGQVNEWRMTQPIYSYWAKDPDARWVLASPWYRYSCCLAPLSLAIGSIVAWVGSAGDYGWSRVSAATVMWGITLAGIGASIWATLYAWNSSAVFFG